MKDFKEMMIADQSNAMIQQRTHADIAKVSKEVEAAVIMANRFPRDERNSYQKIMNALTRPSLAKSAMYEYPKGGQRVTGPSIRMAETMARSWKNLQYGVREIQRIGGASIMEAYCWDLESNVRSTREFTVNHILDTKKGPKHLDSERDIYEHVANQGARRLRACILQIIPDDIVEDAIEVVQQTMLKALKGEAKDLIAVTRAMLDKFKGVGVTREMLEKRIGNKLEAITPQQILNLSSIYNSLNDGMSKPGDWFEMPPLTDEIKQIEADKRLEELENALAQAELSAEEAGASKKSIKGIMDKVDIKKADSISNGVNLLKQLTASTMAT